MKTYMGEKREIRWGKEYNRKEGRIVLILMGICGILFGLFLMLISVPLGITEMAIFSLMIVIANLYFKKPNNSR